MASAAGLVATASACLNRRDDKPAEQPAPERVDGPAESAAEAPAAPAVPEAQVPAPQGISAQLLCREAWGARPPRPGGRPHTITRLTIHHSGVAFTDNRTIAERLRQHQHYHQDQKGWIDIAYHVGIDREGNIFELRSPELAGDTATNYDTTGHFLVLCEGNFEEQTVPDAQLQGAAVAFAWAAQNFRVRTDTLASHRDVDPATACPGANLYERVASGELRRRIDDLLARGPIDLRYTCGAEAASVVTTIESGR